MRTVIQLGRRHQRQCLRHPRGTLGGTIMNRIFLAVSLLVLSAGSATALTQHHLTPVEVAKLKEAINDEIYDYGYYREFYQIGNNTGTPEHWIASVRIYINPVYNATDHYGEIIYKLMPYGQIYRLFYIGKDGDVALDGNPDSGFPITQPSHRTVFMDEEEVRHLEQTWMKSFFVVDTSPTAEMIRNAARRQRHRTGFSDWEYKHPEQNGQRK